MACRITDKAEFRSKIFNAGKKLIVIEFYATWCGPCRKIAPTLNNLAKQYSREAIVMKVDVDKFDDIATEFNVSGMPTFVFMRNCKRIGSFSGASQDNLVNMFNNYAY